MGITNQSLDSNYGKLTLDGKCTISSAAAAGTVVGDNLTCTKTGVGQYTFVFKNTYGVKMYEYFDARAAVIANGALGTVKVARVLSVTQASNLSGDDITVVVETDTAAFAAVDEAVSTFDLGFHVTFRTCRMSSPF